MPAAPAQAAAKPRGWRALFGWRRLRTTAVSCALVSTLFSFSWQLALHVLWLQVFAIGLVLMLVFGLFEQWPRRLPRWLARWALQVVAVGAAVPLLVFTAYVLRTDPGAPPFWLEG